ncbi:MAG: tetratricopeptide repeat protein [Pyrinomonadaceae bacterium]
MFRKFLFVSCVSMFAVLIAAAGVSAQTAPVRGEIKLTKTDGTVVPVADALVEVYRADIRGTMPSSTTNKRGQFAFAALPLGQTYMIAVSAPGIGPRVEPNVRAGREDIVINVTEGDGRKLTEDEVREVIATAVANPGGVESEAAKKEREEIEKKNAEIMAKNKKLQEDDAAARKANEAGVAALKAKDYDAAIARFSEGVAAVPDFVGSTPVMLNGKMVALRARGFGVYREGATNPDVTVRQAKYAQANKDYDEALAAFAQAMKVIENAPPSTDVNMQKAKSAITLELLGNAMEVHRLKAVGGVDRSKGADAAAVITQYLAVETDAAKKAKAEMTLGDILRENGDCDGAIVAYKKILEGSPDNVDALAGAGLCLFSVGYGNSDKAQMQEGLNYMTRFSEIAPDTHQLKTSVKDAVDLLKSEQKLTPQKTPSKRKTK